jgi:hypothetical protein
MQGFFKTNKLYLITCFLYLIFILLLAYIRAYVGSSNMQLVDGGLLVDGAWRILQGQIPHVDFFHQYHL